MLARFIPVVRTVLNPLAGALGVPAAVFTRWQVIGGLLWSTGVTLAGYALGSSIPGIDKYLLPIIALIVVVSLTPIALELRRTRPPPPQQQTLRSAPPGERRDDRRLPLHRHHQPRPARRFAQRETPAAAGFLASR